MFPDMETCVHPLPCKEVEIELNREATDRLKVVLRKFIPMLLPAVSLAFMT